MNINCKKAEEYLVDYLYQELPAKKTLQVEKHLRECNSCKSTLESWRAIHRAYQRSTDEPQISVYTKQKLLAVAEEELRREPSWSERFVLALKIATVPLAIFIVVLFLNSKDEPKMAMQKPETTIKAAPVPEEPTPPAVQEREIVADSRSDAPPPDSNSPGRRDRSLYADRQASEPAESKRREVMQSNKKDEAAGFESRDQLAPATPGAAAPQVGGLADSGNDDVSGQKTKMSRVLNEAQQPFQQAQSELKKQNLKNAKELITKAVEEDDRKELASQLHQQGTIYQSRGEYVNAIMQYENVQTNYRNYANLDDVLLRLGDSYAEVGQFDNALKAYSQVRTQQNIARERIQLLQKKQQATEQLKALGYVSEAPKKEKE